MSVDERYTRLNHFLAPTRRKTYSKIPPRKSLPPSYHPLLRHLLHILKLILGPKITNRPHPARRRRQVQRRQTNHFPLHSCFKITSRRQVSKTSRRRSSNRHWRRRRNYGFLTEHCCVPHHRQPVHLLPPTRRSPRCVPRPRGNGSIQTRTNVLFKGVCVGSRTFKLRT